MSWYENAEVWAAIGSLGAVFISVVALYVSYRRQAEQLRREKREELRGALERLITLREELIELNKEQDEGAKHRAATYLNTKRTIYLEAAELLASQIPHDLSASEYAVLAFENRVESDFAQSKAYYEKAIDNSQNTSVAKRAELMRTLASIYFLADPPLRNIDKGRETYASAIRTLENQADNYSMYGRHLTYHAWAGSETRAKNLTRAADLLDCAYAEFLKIPSAVGINWISGLRGLASSWAYLGAEYFKARDDDATYLKKGRLAFRKAQIVTETLDTRYGSRTDYTIDARGVVFHWWGQQESEAGFRDEGQELLAQAEQEFQRLSDNFQWKDFRLAELRRAQQQIARGEAPMPPPPQELSGDTTIRPGEEKGRLAEVPSMKYS